MHIVLSFLKAGRSFVQWRLKLTAIVGGCSSIEGLKIDCFTPLLS